MLGFVYMYQGRYEEAEEVTRQSLRFVPHHPFPYFALSTELLALQRFDEARQIIHETQTRKHDAMNPYVVMFPHVALYALAFLGADSAAMAEQQQWFAGKPEYENVGLALASDTEGYAGHLDKARELTKRVWTLPCEWTTKKLRRAIWLTLLCKKLLSAMPRMPGRGRQRL